MSLFLQVVSVSTAIGEIRKSGCRAGGRMNGSISPKHSTVFSERCTCRRRHSRFTRSVMDGAVRAADTTGSSDTIPSISPFGAGLQWVCLRSPYRRRCMCCSAGGMLPEGADAVVMIEHAEQIGEEILVKKTCGSRGRRSFFNEDFPQETLSAEEGVDFYHRTLAYLPLRLTCRLSGYQN